MTYDTALRFLEKFKSLISQTNISYDDYLDYDESINVIKEKEDKYKWHNLKENPNDLPTEEGNVLVSLNGEYKPQGRGYGGTTFVHAVDMIYWIEDGKFYAGSEEWMNEFVEAWKWPDQFEEE